MSNNQDTFISKAKEEIQERINNETNSLEQLKTEEDELTNALKGYSNFDTELEDFLDDASKNFNISKKKLPEYFKSNINEVYQNYAQIKRDALEEIDILKRYIEKIKRDAESSRKTLKFYRSQYMDSDFFNECLPLVDIIEEKLEIYQKNEVTTMDIIKKLEGIYKKLEKW